MNHFGAELRNSQNIRKMTLGGAVDLFYSKKRLAKTLSILNLKSGKNGHFAKGSSTLFENHLF